MKRVVMFAMFALAGTLVFSMFYTTAKTLTIAERFTAAKADTTGPAGTYNFDKAHSTIGFRVKHMGLTEIPGYFRDFTGAIAYDPDVTKSSVTFTAKVASIDTGVAPRDGHLKTADFFDAEKFPDITFKSTTIQKKGKQWIVTGDFTMKDVTKSISFPFDIYGFLKGQNGAVRMGLGAETMINRQDYNVKYNSKLPDGTPSVDDNVKVLLQIEANLPGAKTATPKSE